MPNVLEDTASTASMVQRLQVRAFKRVNRCSANGAVLEEISLCNDVQIEIAMLSILYHIQADYNQFGCFVSLPIIT